MVGESSTPRPRLDVAIAKKRDEARIGFASSAKLKSPCQVCTKISVEGHTSSRPRPDWSPPVGRMSDSTIPRQKMALAAAPGEFKLQTRTPTPPQHQRVKPPLNGRPITVRNGGESWRRPAPCGVVAVQLQANVGKSPETKQEIFTAGTANMVSQKNARLECE